MNSTPRYLGTVLLYSMEKDLLKELNPGQQKPVIQTDGPMVILAGAGSGKTRVITYKVLYLIQKGVNPGNILCVTFTNKAAAELKERLQKKISKIDTKSSNIPAAMTFHALCAKILRIDGKHLGISSKFLIYDSQDQIDAIKSAMSKLGISTRDFKPGSILGTISQAKNELVDQVAYKNIAQGFFQQTVASVYPLYQLILKENDALDFDDLILKTVELLQNNPIVLEKYQQMFRYILVDEYQDTNYAQYILTKLLANKWQNLCVVGDFSQSIYSWRGADFTNLRKIQDDFPNTKMFSLSQNYRSTQNILDAASSVISRNTTHPILTLWTENKQGEEVEVIEMRNEHHEAEYIVEKITEMQYQKKISLSEVAVLYRTNAQSRVIEEIFLHHSVPYVLIGGTRFYERKEIKDVLSYLRLFENPKDSVSRKRVEKLGKGRYQKFLALEDAYEIKGKDTIDILDDVINKTDYLSLYDERDEEDQGRLENIKELRSVALEHPALTDFLENVSLVEQEYISEHAGTEKKNAITLMTLHAAKGLEFSVIFMVGMEEGLFPHSRALMDKNELEEERRLCYVGMTRAKEKLILTFARKRIFFGQRSSNMLSRFIMELPERVIARNIQMREAYEQSIHYDE
jgi:DNA helicase-2/ATP-dependent DNA helicase PcrA